MDGQQIPLKVTAARFVRTVRIFVGSDVGWKAKLMFGGLFALLFGLNGLNVVNNYVGRNFMTAIEQRQTGEFIRQAIFYVGVFAALTIIGVIARFVEERLALLWREFLTRRVVTVYLAEGAYHRMDISAHLSNPDQRMADDIREFTVTTLSFIIMLFSSALTVVSFSGVLWSISPLLFGVAVLYAACGSYVTIALGRPLITLNYDQRDREASFRSSLIHVRENAESILLTAGEGRQRVLLLDRLDALVANFRRITAVNRNLGFFTSGYNWMIQLIPDLIIAPAFIRGEIEFGVIIQAGAAFAMLVGAFSLFIRQFNSISNFAAVVSRLSSLVEAIEQSRATAGSTVEVAEDEGRLAFERVTLLTPTSDRPLIKDLSLSVPPGARVLLTGSDHAPGAALFRATAGVVTRGAGRIVRPGPEAIFFVQQRPYLPPGTVRQLLEDPAKPGDLSDDRILAVLHELGLERTVAASGGLDHEADWGTALSLDEQQLLCVARILLAAPHFVFLDRADTTLGSEQLHKILPLLSRRSIACINNTQAPGARDLYDAVLEFNDEGRWNWTEARV